MVRRGYAKNNNIFFYYFVFYFYLGFPLMNYQYTSLKKLLIYPFKKYWYHKMTTCQGTNSVGQASVASSDMTLSLIPAEAHNANTCTILSCTHTKKACDRWILDLGASDHDL